ncbi:hypothetical protein, variant [Puccinia triticina 1-1 BBBD Race 1]|uniref:CCHC-type domain-containing protein n=1 Tax=Puccinia triticina (isolate 1-1 / race 1 (BBBD)) TaxID=630390 RepID=A0A180GI37_PUCT1|nr:hypothetical protein, variant [Puccinia triticina 1-1 BBBD Race 1]
MFLQESASCPNPRTAGGRTCFTCGGVGHLAAECPNTKNLHTSTAGGGSLGGTKCYTCGQFGHVKRSCSQFSNGGSQGSLQARIGGFQPRTPSQPVQCHKCLGMNHLARNCMAIVPPPAFQPRYLKPKTCFNCQLPGHIASNCPGSAS